MRLVKEAAKRHAKACLKRYPKELAPLNLDEELKHVEGAGEYAERTLVKLQNELKDFMCGHVYKGIQVSVKALECALDKANESLANSYDPWNVFQTLETPPPHFELDKEQEATANLERSHEARAVQEVDQIAGNAIHATYQAFVSHPKVEQPISKTLVLAWLVPLSD